MGLHFITSQLLEEYYQLLGTQRYSFQRIAPGRCVIFFFAFNDPSTVFKVFLDAEEDAEITATLYVERNGYTSEQFRIPWETFSTARTFREFLYIFIPGIARYVWEAHEP